MNTNPLVSLITVSYNAAKTIEDTLNSVLAQSYRPIEYWVIDGDSRDGTLEIIKRYESLFAAKGISYRWFSEPDTGIYNAMNKGLAHVNGELVGIINSDDYYKDDAVASVVEAHMNHDADVYHGLIEYIMKDGTHVVRGPFPKNRKGGYTEEYESMNRSMTIKHPSVFIKKSVYQKYGGYDESFRIAADYDLLLRLVREGVRMHYMDRIVTTMRYGGISCNYARTKREVYRVRMMHGAHRGLLSVAMFFDLGFYEFKQVIKRIIGYKR